jgi:hypothetical protein
MDSIITAPTPVHYPESDGKPMGETDVHIDALIYLREALRDHFRDDPPPPPPLPSGHSDPLTSGRSPFPPCQCGCIQCKGSVDCGCEALDLGRNRLSCPLDTIVVQWPNFHRGVRNREE